MSKLLGRILQLINAYKDAWKDFDPEVADTDNTITRFLFGGWSWQFGKFFIYPIHYNPTVNEFRAYTHRKKLKRLQLPKTEKCISIGNYVVEFNAYLQAVIKERKLTVLDYEPLEILARMLKTPKFTDRYSHESPYRPGERTGAIGGAPQMIKIYQHSNYRPVAVRWPPEGATKVTLFGRPLFDFEKTLHPIFDIPNREIYYPLSDVKNRMILVMAFRTGLLRFAVARLSLTVDRDVSFGLYTLAVLLNIRADGRLRRNEHAEGASRSASRILI